MGRVARFDPRRSTLVILLDVAKREVTLQKWVVLQATGMGKGGSASEEMTTFS
jgi:hypothetical protein